MYRAYFIILYYDQPMLARQ